MSKYSERARENRFIVFPTVQYFEHQWILIIDKATGIPFCGAVRKVNRTWDVNGKVIFKYDVWIEEVGILVKSTDTRWETSTLGIF